MRVLDKAVFIEANKANFNPNVRQISSIEYIVCHYTSNTNDTARNNALYFRDTITKSSAHFFVSENTIYQTVMLNHAAYSVGLGSMKNPYIKNPAMYKKITNSNSVSVEICGSKTSSEGSNNTKRTAAMLVADLLEKIGLTPSRVYRHYDVTGKPCPLWAVEDPAKWLEFTLMVSNYYYGKGEDDKLLDTTENYNIFKTWMERYEQEKAQIPANWEAEAMAYCESRGLIKDGRPKSSITRGELATVLMRMNA